MDTTAIIQFIGIVLFSSAIPNDPGVHAILPRIDSGMHAEHTVNAGTAQQPAEEQPMGVEDHVAVILYRDEDVISQSKSWKRTGVLKNNWNFVELDGEQVQFITNRRNDEPKIPRDIPRAVSPASRCLMAATAPVGFRNEFQAPTYRGAEAVVDIPAGILSACAADSRTEANRIDTTLVMKTDGVLVITGKKTTEARAKTITLAGDAVVYVANVPPHFLFTGVAEQAPGEPHWEAYTAMLDTPCKDAPEGANVSRICDLSAISTAWKLAQAKPPSTSLKILDSSCSNTQWP